MLTSTVELLCGVLLSAVTLIIGSCTVGSIVAALRAVSRASLRGRMRGASGWRRSGIYP